MVAEADHAKQRGDATISTSPDSRDERVQPAVLNASSAVEDARAAPLPECHSGPERGTRAQCPSGKKTAYGMT